MQANIDEKILAKLGLSESQAQELIKKHHDFITSLPPEKAAAVKKSFPSAEQAAKVIDPALTTDQLQAFVDQRCFGLGSGLFGGWFGWPIPSLPLEDE